MVLLLFMLDIKNKASLAIKKFIGDLISSSPDLQDKLDNISPISFDFTIADIGPFYIKINKEEITASLDSIKNNDFSISIGLLEATRYITNRTIEKGYIVGDVEKAFELINILKSTNIDLSVLIDRNFGHIPGVLSYLASIKINQNTDVTIPQDKLGQKLRSMSIRLDRLEALGKQK